MKKAKGITLILLIIAQIFLLASCSKKDAVGELRPYMSIEECRKLLGKQETDYSGQIMVFDGYKFLDFGGFRNEMQSVNLQLFFESEKLVGATYYASDPSDKQVETVRSYLEEKYGPPSSTARVGEEYCDEWSGDGWDSIILYEIDRLVSIGYKQKNER